MNAERTYTYRFAIPGDPMELMEALGKAGEMLTKHHKSVTSVVMQHDDVDMFIKLTLKGHDQWWIKKKVVYPLAAMLAKAGIKLKDARLVSVERPSKDGKTRVLTSDGSLNRIGEDGMIDHSDMM